MESIIDKKYTSIIIFNLLIFTIISVVIEFSDWNELKLN